MSDIKEIPWKLWLVSVAAPPYHLHSYVSLLPFDFVCVLSYQFSLSKWILCLLSVVF